MIAETDANVTAAFERVLAERPQEKYLLRLYVAGMTQRSMNSVAALKGLCEKLLPGRYELDVVNLFEHPELAEVQQVLATPTLVKELPLPVRRLVGDLTQPDRVILILQ